MITTIGVLGAGKMGNGIAHVFALYEGIAIAEDMTKG